MGISYKATTRKAGSLLLDPKNARIPRERRSDSQRALLHELLAHQDVRKLAKSIAKLGLFPSERLVVTPEGRRWVVLEGNRRLAAIKLLLNPDLAPAKRQVTELRRWAGQADLSAFAKLEVAIVDSRVAAAPVIAALHTHLPKKRWSSLQQARFYRELVDEGQTAVEVAEDVGESLSTVRDALRVEKLYRCALTLDYAPDVRQKLAGDDFNLTTLERFLQFRAGRAFLGVEVDENESFRGVVHVDRFKAVLGYVAAQVATVPGLTRVVNSNDAMASWVRKRERRIPATKKRGRFTASEILGEEAAEPAEDEDKKKPKRRRAPRPSSSIVPKGFTCTTDQDKIRAIFKDLKSMKIAEHRNSTGVMLRVLLDIALWYYLEKEGHADAACDCFDPTGKRRKYNSDWTPNLRDLISYAVENRAIRGMPAKGYSSIKTLTSRDANYFITIEAFNDFTHHPYVTPTEGDLRALWQRAEPMLEIILND